MVWFVIEMNLAIAFNCAILLRPFINRHLPWLLHRRKQNTAEHKMQGPLASRSIGGNYLGLGPGRQLFRKGRIIQR